MRRLLAGAARRPRRSPPCTTPAPPRPSPPTPPTTCWSSPRPPGSGTTRSRPASRRSATWARPTTSPSPPPRTPPRSPPPTSPSTRRWSSSTPPATCSTPPSRPRSSPTSAAAAATSASTPPPTPSTTGRSTASWSAPGSPRHPAIQQANVEGRGPGATPATAHLPQTWTRTDEWYNYRTNPRSSAHVLATLDESSYSGGTMGADHPHHLVQDRTTAAGPSTPAAGTPRRRTPRRPSAPTCSAASGTRPAGPRPTAGRRPATPPLYNGSTTGWSQAGPGSFTNTDATLTSVGGMGLLWYSAKQFTVYSLKLDWRLAGDDNSGVFVGFPTAGSDPYVGGQQRLRDPDRRHRRRRPHHRRDLHVQVRRHRRPRRGAEPAGGVEHLRAAGRGRAAPGLPQRREDQRLHQHRPGPHRSHGYIGIQNHGTGDDAVVPQHPDQGAGRHAAGRRDRPGRGVQLGQRRRSAFTKAGANGGQTARLHRPGRLGRVQRASTWPGPPRSRARVVSGGAGGADPGPHRLGRPARCSAPSAVPNTGSWDTYANVTTALTGVPSGTAEPLPHLHRHRHRAVRPRRLHTGQGQRRRRTGVGPIKGLAGKCLDVRNAPPPTARRSSSTPATAAPRRPGRVTPNRRQGARQVPGRLRRRHRRRHEDPALDLQRLRRAELGCRSPTARCATRSRASAWTCPATTPPTAPSCTSGPASTRPTRSGPCPDRLTRRGRDSRRRPLRPSRPDRRRARSPCPVDVPRRPVASSKRDERCLQRA